MGRIKIDEAVRNDKRQYDPQKLAVDRNRVISKAPNTENNDIHHRPSANNPEAHRAGYNDKRCLNEYRSKQHERKADISAEAGMNIQAIEAEPQHDGRDRNISEKEMAEAANDHMDEGIDRFDEQTVEGAFMHIFFDIIHLEKEKYSRYSISKHI